MKKYLAITFIIFLSKITSQELKVKTVNSSTTIEWAQILNLNSNVLGTTNSKGIATINTLDIFKDTLIIIHPEYETKKVQIKNKDKILIVELIPKYNNFNEVVVSGNLKEINKLNSVTPIETFSIIFFKSNTFL